MEGANVAELPVLVRFVDPGGSFLFPPQEISDLVFLLVSAQFRFPATFHIGGHVPVHWRRGEFRDGDKIVNSTRT